FLQRGRGGTEGSGRLKHSGGRGDTLRGGPGGPYTGVRLRNCCMGARGAELNRPQPTPRDSGGVYGGAAGAAGGEPRPLNEAAGSKTPPRNRRPTPPRSLHHAGE